MTILVLECLFALSASSPPSWQRLFTLTALIGPDTIREDAGLSSVSKPEFEYTFLPLHIRSEMHWAGWKKALRSVTLKHCISWR